MKYLSWESRKVREEESYSNHERLNSLQFNDRAVDDDDDDDDREDGVDDDKISFLLLFSTYKKRTL